ncbi:MAG TPA: DUF1501 domain-containing protein [Planctomycetaceae bacterium]|nr:DUF1501 domain-containing protein [Planctomycetaceae bacterium]
MLSIPGRRVRTCEGVSRRDWLRAGAIGAGGLALGVPELWAARAGSRTDRPGGAGFGRARSCIVLFMFGAPAHQDTWDLKPEAPAEVRGEFRPIPTSVAGIQVSEHLPRLAQQAGRYALVRSVTHPDNTHTVAMHYMLTGVRHRRPETNPQNAADDFPCFGAVVNAVDHRRTPVRNAPPAPNRSPLPAAVSLNAPANQVSANNHIFPGFFSGFLGAAHDPLFVAQHAHETEFQPFAPAESPQRLLERGRLLGAIDRQRRHLERTAATGTFDAYHAQAVGLLTSPETRRAFDVGSEPEPLRLRYGMTPFGQGCLLARRLVEAGVSLVTVNWERDDAYWDTHADNFNRHKKQLLPNLDQGMSALLDDLDQRGLLDETLVVWLAEFGRTPQINAQAGRDHWAACNTVVLAGAGIRGGQVYGASDRQAAYPVLQPVTPEDLAATIYHRLGIDPHLTIYTPDGRPVALSAGEVLGGLG